MRISRRVHHRRLRRFCRAFCAPSTRLSTAVESLVAAGPGMPALSTPFPPRRPVDNRSANRSGYTRPPAGARSAQLLSFGHDETDLSAERAQAEAEARLPRPHGDARRPADPQAPPLEGPQAPVGVMPPVQRRNRLSRSRDFDAVYRQGRSVSTRFLTLYWFRARRGDRRAAPRLRRAEGGRERRRPQPDQAAAARDRARTGSQAVPPSNDYVLVVRPGLPEAAEANGHDWLDGARRRGARKGRGMTRRPSGSVASPRRSGSTSCWSSPVRPGEHLQVPPELLGVRGARDPQARRAARRRRWRRGGCCAATRGRTAESTTRDRRARRRHPLAAREHHEVDPRLLPHARSACRGPGRSSRSRCSCGSCSCR